MIQRGQQPKNDAECIPYSPTSQSLLLLRSAVNILVGLQAQFRSGPQGGDGDAFRCPRPDREALGVSQALPRSPIPLSLPLAPEGHMTGSRVSWPEEPAGARGVGGFLFRLSRRGARRRPRPSLPPRWSATTIRPPWTRFRPRMPGEERESHGVTREEAPLLSAGLAPKEACVVGSGPFSSKVNPIEDSGVYAPQ